MALASRVLRQCSLVITPRCASCLRPSRSLATLASTAGDSRFLTRYQLTRVLRRSGWVGSVRRRHAVAACVTYGCSLVAYGCRRFLEATQHLEESDALDAAAASEDDDGDASAAQPVDRAADGAGGGAAGGAALGLEVLFNHVRVAPQYSLAALRPGVFLLGMKEQLTVHDLPSHPLYDQVSTAPRRGRVRVCAWGGGALPHAQLSTH